MLSNVGRLLSRRTAATFSSATRSTAVRAMSTNLSGFEDFGKTVFAGSVADEYLTKYGESKALLDDPNWVNTHSDIVANAVFDW